MGKPGKDHSFASNTQHPVNSLKYVGSTPCKTISGLCFIWMREGIQKTSREATGTGASFPPFFLPFRRAMQLNSQDDVCKVAWVVFYRFNGNPEGKEGTIQMFLQLPETNSGLFRLTTKHLALTGNMFSVAAAWQRNGEYLQRLPWECLGELELRTWTLERNEQWTEFRQFMRECCKFSTEALTGWL